tara:strand:+ start:21848 stop:24349 length:2502 start_codon:yes stop_codon:yes gene_type:complete
MFKTTFVNRILNEKQYYLWLSTIGIALVLGEIVVSVMSWILNGVVTIDYLITGLAASVLVGCVVSGLMVYLLRKSSELHLNNEQLIEIINACPIPIALNDLDHNIVMLNREFTRVYGYTIEDIPTLKDWWLKAYPDEDYRQSVEESWALRLKNMNADGTGFEPLDVQVQCNNNATKSVMATATHLGDHHSWANLIVLHDNTERASIVQDHNFLQSIIETIPVRIFWKDKNLRFLGCNTAFANDAGETSPDDIIGKLDSDLSWKDLAERYQADDRSIIQSMQSKLAYEEVQTTPEGKTIWLRTSKMPLLDTVSSETLGMLGIYENITHQKEIENALWLTKTLVDKSQTAFFHLSPTGVILYANEYACNMLDYTHDKLIGKQAWDLDSAFTETGWTQLWNKLRNNGIVNFETQYLRKNGLQRDIDVTCHYISYKGQEYNFVVVLNISDRKKVERTLRQKEAYQRALLDNFPFNVWLKDTDSRFLAVNQTLTETLGYSDKDSLIGKDDFDIATSDVAEHYRNDDIEVMTSRQQKIVEEVFKGTTRDNWMETFKAPAIDETGVLLGTVGFSRDITDRKAIEAELQIAAVAFESQESIIITDANSVILKINQSFTRMTGYTEEEAIGQNMHLLKSGVQDSSFYAEMWKTIHNTGSWHGEIWNRRKSGEIYPEWLTITAVKDKNGTITNYVGTMLDITARKAIERKTLHLAHHDALTDLPNRTLLTDRLNQALAHVRRENTMLALMFLDLDKFKPVNDILGHDIGDLLLIEVAERLLSCVRRESDTVSRVGGDEFVVLLARIEHEGDAEIIAQNILNALPLTSPLIFFIIALISRAVSG